MRFAFVLMMLLHFHLNAQHPFLKSGPSIGYVDHERAYILVDAAPNIQTISITWREKLTAIPTDSLEITRAEKDTGAVIFKVKHLKPSTSYVVSVRLNGLPVNPGFTPEFKTAVSNPESDETFSFLFGSCLYINDPGEKQTFGNSPDILGHMSKLETDFMIWGGDNMYLRNDEWNSRQGILSRYYATRRFPQMQPLMGTRANFAVCDDHDYGPDDCTGSYDLANESCSAFRFFWPAKHYASGKDKGIYHKFTWGDCEFFMMDDRTYRSGADMPGVLEASLNREKRYYGKQQLAWLIESLGNSKATFKFIVSGGQMINPLAEKECFRYYNYEYNKLIRHILSNKIEGVVFLSGDRHFTELIATQPEGGYTLFDFTCSSLTSETRSIKKTKEIDNPYRIPGTLYMDNNFSKLTITGKKGDRKINIETKDSKGKAVWDFVIKESDVKFIKRKE